MECTGVFMVLISAVLLAIAHAASVSDARQGLEPSLEKLKGFLKTASIPDAENSNNYYTDDILPPVYLSKTIDAGDEDKRGTLFRYGKRGSIFRFGKRGYMFRYGKSDRDEFNDGLAEDRFVPDDFVENDDKRAIFRYGKRRGASARLHAPFRFGKDLDKNDSRRK